MRQGLLRACASHAFFHEVCKGWIRSCTDVPLKAFPAEGRKHHVDTATKIELSSGEREIIGRCISYRGSDGVLHSER